MFLPTNITLKFGDSGDFVSELQRRLSIVHCFGADAINGFFDGATVNGVSQFQSMSGIRADGIAGPETLRRLNGALSGDNSTSDAQHAAEEEAARQQQAAELLRQQLYIAEQQRLMEEAQQLALQQQQQAAMAAQQAAYMPAAHEQPVAATPQPQYTQQPVYQAPIQQQTYVPPPQQYEQQPVHQPVHQQQAHQQQAHPQPHTPQLQPNAQQQVPPLQPMQPQAHTQQPAAQPMVPPHAHVIPVAQQQPQAIPPQAYQEPAAQQQPAAPAQEPRGIVGRAVQYANAVVQKLAAYFEEKLPAPVLHEVKQIGHAMANSGMKEAPIPTGPEQQRERGIEQQRGQQQGKQIG